MSHTFQNIDDATSVISQEEFEELQETIHKHPLSGYFSREEGSAAVMLNVYRLNYGGDPEGFEMWVKGLSEGHFWKAEYARANLAWNISRVEQSLRKGKGEGLDVDEGEGEDVDGEDVDVDEVGEKDKTEEEEKGDDEDKAEGNESTNLLWKTLGDMEKVEKRNLLTDLPFPLERPPSLTQWYPDQTPLHHPRRHTKFPSQNIFPRRTNPPRLR